jgi:hypothetical protein
MKVTLDFLTKAVLTPSQQAQMEHELVQGAHQHIFTTIEQANAADIANESQGTDGAA